MNCLVVCKFDDTKGRTKFNYLVGWDATIEETNWSSRPITWHSLNSYLEDMLENVKAGDWQDPHFFASCNEAKKAIDTIRAYDIPGEGCSNISYYLVKTETRIVPKGILKATEL